MGNKKINYAYKKPSDLLSIMIIALSNIFAFIFIILALRFNSIFNYQTILILASLVYVWIFKTWQYYFKSYFNSYLIFIGATYIFYFGQYLLFALGNPLNLDHRMTIVTTYSTEQHNLVALFIVGSILLVHSGAMFGVLITKRRTLFNKHYTNESSIKASPEDVISLKLIAILLLGISYIPTIIIYYDYIKTVFTIGYANVFTRGYYTSGGFNNILGFLSTFVIPGLLAGVIAFKDSKYKKVIYLLVFVYVIMYFLSGSRYNAVMLILSILLIKEYFLGGFKRLEKIKFITGGSVLIIIVSLISSIRSELYRATKYTELIVNALRNLIDNNILVSFLREFGFTLVATTTVFVNCPNPVEYVYGKTYISSFLRLFPNLFWDVHPAAGVSVDSVFKSFLTSYGGIGSSFIAEAYYNFGYFSILFMPLIGFFLFLLFNKMQIASKTNDIGKGFLTIYIFCFTLFYVRSDTGSFWRNLVYYGYLPYFMFLGFRSSIKKLQKSDRYNVKEYK